MKTSLQVQTRYNRLIGESTATNADSVGLSHINASILDIVNKYPFSWNITTASQVKNTALPADYNPIWGIKYAKDSDDNELTRVSIDSSINYTSGVYWLTYDTATQTYIFNSYDNATVYYYFVPTDLSGDSDKLIVPDMECVAYWAAAKNWIGDERNVQLQSLYENEAEKRVKNMYQNDLMFSEVDIEGSIVDLQDVYGNE